ncbi:hypothetical protein CVT24_008648 [Panaeolus cyanescens]|uniref:F-box domain-containing protein n=1 Tax=Panaeolus cyanescens TaxID=181874 RepID=A0A409VDR2_9AGAR|nr:hypothetical protein CVT24_008648 [Panaeolus cyanescens]
MSGVFLKPRPFEKAAGTFLLLPLLPQPRPMKPLPVEVWAQIFAFSLAAKENDHNDGYPLKSLDFLIICKSFHDIVLPLIYETARISNMSSLEKFFNRLYAADQKWDGLRRIPYSTPGRWVQNIDLSDIAFESQPQAIHFDTILTKLFPLTPFLMSLSINPSLILSRRALVSLASREGSVYLRSLSGISYFTPFSPVPDEDPFVQLLRNCPNLEELYIVGQGLDPLELEFNLSALDFPSMKAFHPLRLPKLRFLSMLSMHSSPLMLALLHSPLPGLRKLTLTPYHDFPYPVSLASEFISTHGTMLSSLLLFTPKSWPTRLHPSSEDLLIQAPNLRHLSLENPLPDLQLHGKHPLSILSIPRPKPEFWRTLERLLPLLPNLVAVRARDVRWLRKGISSHAQTAGVQGEMCEWKKRLERRGIRMLDSDWNDRVRD